jgi:hypothetical protein
MQSCSFGELLVVLSFRRPASVLSAYELLINTGIPEPSSSARQHLQPPIPSRQLSEQRLIQHLLRGYDTDARGVNGNANETIRVEIQLLLLRIQGLVRI